MCVLSSKSCCIQPIEDTNIYNALEEECVVGAELKVIEKTLPLSLHTLEPNNKKQTRSFLVHSDCAKTTHHSLNMFECTLSSGELFKKIVSALSDLVEQGNFQVDANMISFQGMDSSHVSLVSLSLTEGGFENYRCDSNQVLGIQFAALNKILKCMTSKDSLSIQAQDDGDLINFIFESQDQKRYSNFELKLNDIDAEQLGIPDTDYGTTVKMPSGEFQRICRDLAAIGDTVTISATKQGVQFAVDGDIGAGSMMIKGMNSGGGGKDEDAT